MNFFFDANISRRIANMVAALCEDVHVVLHITQHKSFIHNNNESGGNSTPDIEWITTLGESEEDWKIISGEANIIDTAHERAALIESRLTFFSLDRNWAKASATEQAWKMVKIWDEIVRHASDPGQSLY
jgi:hypothetical protein